LFSFVPPHMCWDQNCTLGDLAKAFGTFRYCIPDPRQAKIWAALSRWPVQECFPLADSSKFSCLAHQPLLPLLGNVTSDRVHCPAWHPARVQCIRLSTAIVLPFMDGGHERTAPRRAYLDKSDHLRVSSGFVSHLDHLCLYVRVILIANMNPPGSCISS